MSLTLQQLFRGINATTGMLISYWQAQQMRLDLAVYDLPVRPRLLMADSGAFSAKHTGVEIELDDYIDWCWQYQDILDVTVNLDVINNAAASEANLREMQRQGLDPMPVFHYGSDWRVLDEMADEFDLLGLGGIALYSRTRNMA